MWREIEPVQFVRSVEVQRNPNERPTVGSTPGAFAPRVMDELAEALVTGPRNVELCSMFSEAPVVLGDWYRWVVEPDDLL